MIPILIRTIVMSHFVEPNKIAFLNNQIRSYLNYNPKYISCANNCFFTYDILHSDNYYSSSFKDDLWRLPGLLSISCWPVLLFAVAAYFCNSSTNLRIVPNTGLILIKLSNVPVLPMCSPIVTPKYNYHQTYRWI